jgi:hypothetical protein
VGELDATQLSGEWLLWVKTGKAQNEQMFSGLPPIADIQAAATR